MGFHLFCIWFLEMNLTLWPRLAGNPPASGTSAVAATYDYFLILKLVGSAYWLIWYYIFYFYTPVHILKKDGFVLSIYSLPLIINPILTVLKLQAEVQMPKSLPHSLWFCNVNNDHSQGAGHRQQDHKVEGPWWAKSYRKRSQLKLTPNSQSF